MLNHLYIFQSQLITIYSQLQIRFNLYFKVLILYYSIFIVIAYILLHLHYTHILKKK